MPRIRKSIDIHASSENIFNYVTNPSTQPDWIRFVRGVEVTSGDGKSRGTTDRYVFKMGPRAHEVESVWTEYEPPSRFATRVTSGLEMEGRWVLQPANEGTQVEWTVSYKPPMGPMGVAFDALFMNRIFQNEMEESLETLKAQMEG